MLLAIDVGNTNTVFAVFAFAEKGQIAPPLHQWRIATLANRTADEYALLLQQLFAIEALATTEVSGIIIANVVPDTQYDLVQMCRRLFSHEPIVVRQDSLDFGMVVKLDKPEEVGADRLVNAVEAWHRYQSALLIVDFGTATTFDVVDGTGAYCGGVIAPGVQLSLGALQQAAAKLPTIRIKKPKKMIGTSTISAMESGIYYGYAHLTEGIIKGIIAEYGAPMKVIATGGLATLFHGACPKIEQVVDDLTMTGLCRLYERNRTHQE